MYENMRLSHIAILAIKGGGRAMVKKLAQATYVSDATVYKWIQDNSDNLTKAAALKVIREETGLTDEQILEMEICKE
jgi:hypothetical protein